MKLIYSVIFALLLSVTNSFAQELTQNMFIGTWYGTVEGRVAEFNEGNITIEFKSDGSYTENTGVLTSGIYDDTEEWSFDETNQILTTEWLRVVYAGQRTYTTLQFKVAKYENDVVELHWYDSWEGGFTDPEALTIKLTMSTTNVEEKTNSQRRLLRVIDMMGNELPLDSKGQLLIYQYENGDIDKKYIQE